MEIRVAKFENAIDHVIGLESQGFKIYLSSLGRPKPGTFSANSLDLEQVMGSAGLLAGPWRDSTLVVIAPILLLHWMADGSKMLPAIAIFVH